MEWTLDKGRPLCPQICEQVCMLIALGECAPGTKLFSVRDAAIAAGVNPNTVQRSFETLEQQGILYSVRGSGWYVSEDISAAQEELSRLRAEKTEAYFAEMHALGLESEAVKKYVDQWYTDRKEG